MMIRGKKAHDNYLNLLFEEYKDEYNLLVKNKRYSDNLSYLRGEIDLLGIIDTGYIDLFEVKSRKTRNSKKKAKRQLNRAEEYYNTIDTIVNNKYIYYGDSDELVRL